MDCYHFCREDMRLGYEDGREIKVGETLKVEGKVELCSHGLHASKRLIDALQYAPGPILCKVKLAGEIIVGDDKVVAQERTVTAYADCTDILREFARKCALDVIHLWDAPGVVVKYLKTGDDSIRAAARAAAWDATWAADRDAAWDAAWATARAAARDAARDAAWDAAWAAAWAAARDAAWAAARDAAWAADRDAAWDAAWEKQNRRLVAMVRKANWVTQ